MTAAGWYPDPAGGVALRYWDGSHWTTHYAPTHPPAAPAVGGFFSLERIIMVPYAVVFGGLAFVCVVSGQWKSLGGVAFLAVLVGAPLVLVLMAARRSRQVRQNRLARREYEAGLALRSEQQHQAMMRGEINAGVFGAFQPYSEADSVFGAEQMREQAWQPELGDQVAVRPSNPAPWHVVTQFPTRQFQSQADNTPEGRPAT